MYLFFNHGFAKVEPKCGNLVAIFGQRVTRIVRLERSGHNLDIRYYKAFTY